jgi:phage terminase small subunit
VKTELTPKQTRFVEEYMVDSNATQAAIRAGYSPKAAEWTGPRLVTKSHVLQAIEQCRATLSERTLRQATDVLIDIGRVREHCISMVDTEKGKVMRSPREALRALELEGRHLGMFEDKDMEVTVNMVDPGQLNQIYAENMALARQRQAEILRKRRLAEEGDPGAD